MAKAKANPNHKTFIEWESLTQGFRENQIISCDNKGGQIAVSEYSKVIRLGSVGVNPNPNSNPNPNPNPIALSETLTPKP